MNASQVAELILPAAPAIAPAAPSRPAEAAPEPGPGQSFDEQLASAEQRLNGKPPAATPGNEAAPPADAADAAGDAGAEDAAAHTPAQWLAQWAPYVQAHAAMPVPADAATGIDADAANAVTAPALGAAAAAAAQADAGLDTPTRPATAGSQARPSAAAPSTSAIVPTPDEAADAPLAAPVAVLPNPQAAQGVAAPATRRAAGANAAAPRTAADARGEAAPATFRAAAAEAMPRAAAPETPARVDAPAPGVLQETATVPVTGHASHHLPAATRTEAPAVPGTPVPLHPSALQERLDGALRWMAGGGLHTAQIRVDPESLGPITIHMRLDGDVANVVFGSNHEQTRQALENSLAGLKNALSSGGLQLGQASVGSEQQGQFLASQQFGERAQRGASGTDSASFPASGIAASPAAAARQTSANDRMVDLYA